MIIFPAIDLKDGSCVRLKKGDMGEATIFNDNPGNQARLFASEGFQWIHVVDLNGAFAGRPVNSDAVKSIIDNVDIPVQLGGGIRDIQTIDGWLGSGVRRVILGTAALNNPKLVEESCKKYPGQIVVGIDAKDGKVAVDGWANTSSISVNDLANKFADVGVSAIIYTDINRDGILAGPDIVGTRELIDAVNIPIIASGGVSCLDDLVELGKLDLEGVIVGRAIYDGKVDSKEALKIQGAKC